MFTRNYHTRATWRPIVYYPDYSTYPLVLFNITNSKDAQECVKKFGWYQNYRVDGQALDYILVPEDKIDLFLSSSSVEAKFNNTKELEQWDIANECSKSNNVRLREGVLYISIVPLSEKVKYDLKIAEQESKKYGGNLTKSARTFFKNTNDLSSFDAKVIANLGRRRKTSCMDLWQTELINNFKSSSFYKNEFTKLTRNPLFMSNAMPDHAVGEVFYNLPSGLIVWQNNSRLLISSGNKKKLENHFKKVPKLIFADLNNLNVWLQKYCNYSIFGKLRSISVKSGYHDSIENLIFYIEAFNNVNIFYNSLSKYQLNKKYNRTIKWSNGFDNLKKYLDDKYINILHSLNTLKGLYAKDKDVFKKKSGIYYKSTIWDDLDKILTKTRIVKRKPK